MFDTFQALSLKALESNSTLFLNQAQQTFKTLFETNKGDLNLRQKTFETFGKALQESLGQMNEKIHLLEKVRVQSFTKLDTQIEAMTKNQGRLEKETRNLVDALKKTPRERALGGDSTAKRGGNERHD